MNIVKTTAFFLAAFTLATLQVSAQTDNSKGFEWKSEVPKDCPFEQSQTLKRVYFTGRHSDYICGDTFYPSWASDGNMYSPWTDGVTDGVRCSSGGNLKMGYSSGHAVMTGDDPVNLTIKNTSPPKKGYAAPYRGRYPCGSLVHNGIWYYGTYCLGPSATYTHSGFRWNWPNLGPMPGFQISKDLGKTWTDSPLSPVNPLFPEPARFLGPVKMGAPHFVDFGKNMEHSPDGKAYLLGMGAEVNDAKPRPCITAGTSGTVYRINKFCQDRVQLGLRSGEAASKEFSEIYKQAFQQVNGQTFAHGNLSWITADQVYLSRVKPSPETINDVKAYEFFAGHDKQGNPLWTSDFEKIKPLIEWNNNMGCVTATYVPGLKKYLMCITDGWPTVAKMNSYILEADKITGPWRMVTYMKDFGEQAYFLNFPSKFISDDGKTLWLCYSANFSDGWNGVNLKINPPGGRYGLSLHEIKLQGPEDAIATPNKETPPIARTKDLKKYFSAPPLKYAPRPLWFWNNTAVTEQGIAEQMQLARDKSGYGGFGILPFGKSFQPKYLTEDYFRVYGVALKKAKELGMTMCLYDEYGYPSGSAGASHGDGVPRFAQKHPNHTIKRLDKHEEDVSGPSQYSASIPESGRLMSIVAMEMESRQRIDLTSKVKEGKVTWNVPRGKWKVMTFMCVKDGDPNVDYLAPEGVAHFVQMTHQQYYNRFKEYFGNTIDGTFNDEPTMYRAKGRIWTGAFNEKFRKKHGFDPAPFYPALWYDIGPQTQAARNYLFGFRSELYATGFPKVIQDWCDKHDIAATGHQDQEEVVNPVSVSGDLMLCFKHQDIPGVDKIGGNRPAERFYKVISSAAYNWDKALVMSETYGAMGDIEWDTIYHIAMEQYTKGINQLIPHAVWYDNKMPGLYKPELSWRHDKYADGLPQYNKYMSRLNLMLQNHGRHIADIAVLYPIVTLQAGHYLDGKLGHYKGGVVIPEADYVEVGELLATQVGRDYTFIHPEVLDTKCSIKGTSLKLDNTINHEEYKVIIMPGHKTISWPNLRKIKAFYDQGGKVIATGTLPSKSGEFGHDEDVVATIKAMFPDTAKPATNPQGGIAVFLEKPTAETLRQTLDSMLDVYDVAFEVGKELRYIHKVIGSKDVYFFANLSKTPVSTWVKLKGKMSPEAWDPHTGEIAKPESAHEKDGSSNVTKVRIDLPPTRSLFIVAEQTP